MNKPLTALTLASVHFVLCGVTLVAQTPPVPPDQAAGQPPKPVDPMQAAQHRQAGRPEIKRLRTGAPNSWFKRTQLQMGDHLKKEVVKGRFAFKNPHKREIVWSNLNGSCQCAKVIIRVGKRKYTLSRQPEINSLHEVTLKAARS